MKGKSVVNRFMFVLILGLIFACATQPNISDLAGEWVVDEEKAVEMLSNIEDLIGVDLEGKSEDEITALVRESNTERWVLFESVDANTMKVSWIVGTEKTSTETIRLVKQEDKSFSFAGSQEPEDVATITFMSRDKIKLADEAGQFTIYLRRK